MKTLLHICCAPCSIMCIDSLRNEGIEPVGFWFNPNIHPLKEYKMRKNTLVDYAKSINMKLIKFIEGIYPDWNNRCGYCYTSRLEETAKCCAEKGYDSFTTTLLISPYQNHNLMIDIGHKMAEKYGVEFLYRDFRPMFKEGQNRAREMELYMQKYCGCVFSEEDRYTKRKKSV